VTTIDHLRQGPSASDQTRSTREVDEVAALDELFDDAINVVVLHRRPEECVLAEARTGPVQEPGFSLMLPVPASGAGWAELAARLPGMPHLAAELRFWVEVLSELTGCDSVGVRLARLETALCPRFHVDKVTVRLVCTLLGAGTEYLPTEGANRRFLGHQARAESDELSGLLRGGARVQRATAGDIVLLKGEAWPGNQDRGAVHRSPSASTSDPRLVLTLDPLG